MNWLELPQKYRDLAKGFPPEADFVDEYPSNLYKMFVFKNTPQGHNFWMLVIQAKTVQDLPKIKEDQVNFINLTNGLEFFDKVDNPQFLRIRSTTLERKDFLFLLMDLDHNFLMNLALGKECVVYDCGTNKALSKTIYLGIPFIRYALQRRWL